MIAREVPIHACMRTTSGTSSARKTSYSTGTMTAPPPIPKSPASMPTRMPAPAIQSASKAISPIGYPSSMMTREYKRREILGRDVRQIGVSVQHQCESISHDRCAGPGLYSLGRQMPAERARTWNRMEESECMPRYGVQADAFRQFTLDIWN